MEPQITFDQWLDKKAKEYFEKKDHSDEPELLRKLGHFNPTLYFLIIDDFQDIRIFERIDEIREGSNLILFSAAFFLIYETSTSISLSGGNKNLGNIIADTTAKIIPRSRAIIEIGSGVAGASARVYSQTVSSNLELTAKTALSLDDMAKKRISFEIGNRILDLELSLPKTKTWYATERTNEMIKFWKAYHLKLFGYSL